MTGTPCATPPVVQVKREYVTVPFPTGMATRRRSWGRIGMVSKTRGLGARETSCAESVFGSGSGKGDGECGDE